MMEIAARLEAYREELRIRLGGGTILIMTYLMVE